MTPGRSPPRAPPGWTGTLASLAADVQRSVEAATGLSCSVGIGDNKLRAKLATGFAKPAGVPDPRAIQFDHLSLNLPDEHALDELRTRLEAHGCEVTETIDHRIMRSIYFTDPNGIALEASCWLVDATGRATDYDDVTLFGDRDPVPAVLELARTGLLESTPATRLVGDDVLDPA